MPNKYEREIEEILRNMDRADQGQSLSERIRAFNRPARRTRPAGPRVRLRMKPATAFLVLGIVFALVGAGLSYYFNHPDSTPLTYLIGAIGVLAFLSFVCGLFIGWSERFGHAASPMWRGQRSSTPRRLHPMGAVVTQFRILRLKWRYWRTRGK
jgi:hypothetical protein